MAMERIESKKLGEGYYSFQHESGLRVLLYPMPEYNNVYALFGTRYGSIDTTFARDGEEMVTVPAGIAHFLEHKLFEDEDGDAFAKYAKTGASANAYTSFDRTAYLFGCTEKFRESLEILVGLVTKPYFTPASVQKEQGIIGQEIRMYDDNPDWRVFFNMLSAMYVNHPIRIDIAGTVESIAQIDDQLLYRCYNTFYNLNNMVLSIAGNFEIDEVTQILDSKLQKAEPISIHREEISEPREVGERRVEQRLEVALPLFHIGYKGISKGPAENFKRQPLMEVLLEAILGEATPLYRRLYDSGLINVSFDDEVLSGESFFSTVLSGESKDPDRLFEEINAEITRMREEGIGKENFERAKKACYGRYIGMYSNTESVASLGMAGAFADCDTYTLLDIFNEITEEQLMEVLLENIDPQYACLSVVCSPEGEEADE